jgi:hypothetical protein
LFEFPRVLLLKSCVSLTSLPPVGNPSNPLTFNLDLKCILACREFDVSKEVIGTSGKSQFGVSGASGSLFSSGYPLQANSQSGGFNEQMARALHFLSGLLDFTRLTKSRAKDGSRFLFHALREA